MVEQTKKIFAVVPISLYERMQAARLFGSNWDSWVGNLIERELDREARQDGG